jgi:hypothetical protein
MEQRITAKPPASLGFSHSSLEEPSSPLMLGRRTVSKFPQSEGEPVCGFRRGLESSSPPPVEFKKRKTSSSYDDDLTHEKLGRQDGVMIEVLEWAYKNYKKTAKTWEVNYFVEHDLYKGESALFKALENDSLRKDFRKYSKTDCIFLCYRLCGAFDYEIPQFMKAYESFIERVIKTPEEVVLDCNPPIGLIPVTSGNVALEDIQNLASVLIPLVKKGITPGIYRLFKEGLESCTRGAVDASAKNTLYDYRVIPKETLINFCKQMIEMLKSTNKDKFDEEIGEYLDVANFMTRSDAFSLALEL